MAEEAKRVRAVAKGLFTRACKNCERSIDDNADVDIVETRFARVLKEYANTQEKHEEYMSLADGASHGAGDLWMEQIDREFEKLEGEKFAYKSVKKEIMEETIEVKSEQRRILSLRNMEESAFTHQIENCMHLIQLQENADEPLVEAIKEAQLDLKRQLNTCREINQKYIMTLDTLTDAETGWINILQEKMSKINLKVAKFCKDNERKNKPQMNKLRLEPIKMPRFDGNIREYARFKADFTKQVVPELKGDSNAAYVLKSCLSKVPLEIVRNVDDNLDMMWERLDEKYGKVSKFTDAVMNDIKRFRAIRDDDDKRLLEFVGVIETGYRDLLWLNLEKEISNSTAVSMIEEKLPRDLRKAWALEISKTNSTVRDNDKFPSLLQFLQERKRAIEYEADDLRISNIRGEASHVDIKEKTDTRSNPAKMQTWCVIHSNASHDTNKCTTFASMNPQERMKCVWENKLCYVCLGIGHIAYSCRNRKGCDVDGCPKFHNSLLHEGMVEAVSHHYVGKLSSMSGNTNGCLLQIMAIRTVPNKAKPLIVFFDAGATISLITFAKAAILNLHGNQVSITITKVGGIRETISSYQYSLPLVDKHGGVVELEVYGIDKISTAVKGMDISGVTHLFDVNKSEIRRPTGNIDVLVGFEYAGFHPQKEQSVDHLLLMSNQFGKCLGGSHPLLQECTHKIVKHVVVNTIRHDSVKDFYDTEVMGVKCSPACGSCKCGSCPPGGKSYTLREERELKLIESGLQHMGDHWMARYPWKRDPCDLPDNYNAALRMLEGIERRLLKNERNAIVYQEQIDDMINRGVARKLSQNEIDNYKGPIHYISHHDVLKPESSSTPCRIVFNSSASFKGHVLNEYWAKGPDLIINLLAILLRFREERVAVTGDIRKMYHAVRITSLDQQTHRFLWRNLQTHIEPGIYIITRVSFGDRPAGNIAIMALRKTADMGRKNYPDAADVICNSTYVDDVADSFSTYEEAKQVTADIDNLIGIGGFEIKEWTYSPPLESSKVEKLPLQGDDLEAGFVKEGNEVDSHKVLGLVWSPKTDVFRFVVHLNFSPKRRKQRTGPDLKCENIPSQVPICLSKRMILSQINGIYDPMGLASPFTVKAKIYMRNLWSGESEKLGWDDCIPLERRQEWISFFRKLFQMEKISFNRCIKPHCVIGSPYLIIFCDGSDDAFGACAYARWKVGEESYESTLIAAKNRITPLKRMTTVRSELCGAILGARLKVFIEKESRLKFEKVFLITDSRIVQAMVHKDSYGFRTFVAVRVGEIQDSTDPDNWYWVESRLNVSDWLTRGKNPCDLGENSIWQKGPEFLRAPEESWPIKSEKCDDELPELVKVIMSCVSMPRTLLSRIDVNRFSNYKRLIRVTARVLAMYERPNPSFKRVAKKLKPSDLDAAEKAWFKEAQSVLHGEFKRGELRRLCPKLRADGIIIVGNRAIDWGTYDNSELILLPYKHHFSRLYAECVHCEEGHLGVMATTSKIRTRVWITNLPRMMKSIKNRCIECKKKNKEYESQCMGPLPEDRLKPAPVWSSTSIDFFGPIEIKGEVNKRSRGKVFGVLFNCLISRAVYVDLSVDYSTEGLLIVLRRFVSLRGYPSKMFSDPGSQLVAASKELREIIAGFDTEKLCMFGLEKGLEWKFSPPDSPWQNGCAEALVKSVKKALKLSIGSQILSFAELQTACFEAANLVNERPIGRHPTSPEDGAYLSPNHLLLGRASIRAPSGLFSQKVTSRRRLEFIDSIVDTYWRRWTRDYFPSLIMRQKWHVERRNVQRGDVVIVQDPKQSKGNWKLARVSNTFPSADGKVRRIELEYKNEKEGSKTYTGTGYTRIERSVQKIIVLIPAGNEDES